MEDNNIVENWLRSLNLVHYTQAFVDNGYDDLEICKQIGHPDLDAIGVEKESHRKDILKAVQILREKGGTHVYFILENPDYQEHNGIYSDTGYIRDRALPPVPLDSSGDDGEGEGGGPGEVPQPLKAPGSKGEEGYAEGRKAFVTYPKLQLTSIVRDKLEADNIDLLKEPYTNEVGTLWYVIKLKQNEITLQ
jgi:hypothetical protein